MVAAIIIITSASPTAFILLLLNKWTQGHMGKNQYCGLCPRTIHWILFDIFSQEGLMAATFLESFLFVFFKGYLPITFICK